MKRVVAAAFGVVILLTISLAFVAGRVTSPRQRAAEARSPAVSVPTATAQMRVLGRPVVARGTVVYDRPITLDLSTAAEGTAVVTFAPLVRGETVTSGENVLEVSGHPVFAFGAPFSPYRDLSAGEEGRDVRVLKEAIRALGYRTSRGDELTAADMAALGRLVRARGYELPRSGDGEGEAGEEDAARADTTAERAEGDSQPGSGVPSNASSVTRRAAPVFPASWWIGVQHLPAKVASAGPRVGERLTGNRSPLSLSTQDPVLKVTAPEFGADRIVPGASLTFEVDGSRPHTWRVRRARPLGEAPPAEGEGGDGGEATGDAGAADGGESTGDATAGGGAGDGTAAWLLHVDRRIPTGILGETGKVTVTSRNNTPVLAVPITAITEDRGGATAVRAVTDTGRTLIPVTLGEQDGGWVSVTARSGTLRPGTVVELG